MKTNYLIVAAVSLAALTAPAQDARVRRDAASEAAVREQRERAKAAYRSVEAPNAIQSGRVTYRGAAPLGWKLRNPLQLINPFAPASAGKAEQNLVPPMPGDRAQGIAVVSVNF